ncbi:HAMP domain-containing protein [bacterium]|nr:HAMP domain-containing protein [bacterium]
MRLSGKLTLTLVTLSVATAAVSGAIIYDRARLVLERAALEKMQAIRHARSEFVVTYFDFLRSHSRNFAKNLMVLDATTAFVEGFDELREKKLSPEEDAKLKQLYETQFLPFADRFSDSPTPMELVYPTSDAARFLHVRYIAENPHPLNSKHNLHQVEDGSKYARAHTKFQALFDDFRQELGYIDLLLVDPRSEEIVYTVRKGMDLGANLAEGPAADSKLAVAVRKIRDKREPGAVEFVDFERYVASWWRPSMFVVTGVFRDQELAGILILQISDEVLSQIVGGSQEREDSELGQTGEVYLIGTDGRMRSESRLFRKDRATFLERLEISGDDAPMQKRIERAGTTILAERRLPENFGNVFATSSATTRVKGRSGNDILTSFERLDLGGLPWGIVAQMDLDEATAWSSEFRSIANSSLLLSCLLASVVACFAARALTRPLQQVNLAARAFANGFYSVRVPVRTEDEIGDLATTFNEMAAEIESKTTRLKSVIEESDRLLEHMMPPLVLARFHRREVAGDATPFGSDITLAFVEIMELDRLFDFFETRIAFDRFDEINASFDEVATRSGMEKLGHVGTGHMFACGLSMTRFDHTTRVLNFAQELQWIVDSFNAEHNTSVFLNIGVHRGPISTGRLGRMHFVNELWKRTIELAKEIDQSVRKSSVRVSNEAFQRVDNNGEFAFAENEIGSTRQAWTLLRFSGKRLADA